MDSLALKGRYLVEHVRDEEVIGTYEVDNLVLSTAKALILNSMFNAASTLPDWYIGLINNTPTPAIVSADVMSSHAGWVEYNGVQNESLVGQRPLWGRTTATGNTIASTAASIFNFTAAGIVYGLFIASNATLGGTSGLLFSAAAFSSTITVLVGDQMRVTYSLQI
jgi:hypothetical protein